MTRPTHFLPGEVDRARSLLTARQFEVWTLRRQGMSWGEMRWHFHCSRQSCQQTYVRAVQLLLEAADD